MQYLSLSLVPNSFSVGWPEITGDVVPKTLPGFHEVNVVYAPPLLDFTRLIGDEGDVQRAIAPTTRVFCL